MVARGEGRHPGDQGRCQRRPARNRAQRAQEPIRVHINGVEQPRGEIWDVRGGEIVFTRPIVKEEIGTGRWMAMYLGLFGSYRKNETVDVEYALGGQPKLIADVEILPD